MQCVKPTLGGHGNDGFSCGVLPIISRPYFPVIQLKIILTEELLQGWRFRQELFDHIPAYVWSLFEPKDAKNLGFDGVQSHQLALVPELTCGALLGVLCRYWLRCGGIAQTSCSERAPEAQVHSE